MLARAVLSILGSPAYADPLRLETSVTTVIAETRDWYVHAGHIHDHLQDPDAHYIVECELSRPNKDHDRLHNIVVDLRNLGRNEFEFHLNPPFDFLYNRVIQRIVETFESLKQAKLDLVFLEHDLLKGVDHINLLA